MILIWTKMICTKLYAQSVGLVDIEWNQYLVHLSTSTRGHKSRFVIPHTKSTVFTNSFFPRTIRDWNSLAVDPAEYKSLEAFKLALKVFTCTCLH